MGNCVKRQSAAGAGRRKGEESRSATEVKIKISRKQLQEILRKVDSNELLIDDTLSRLVSEAAAVEFNDFHHNGYHWRPDLESIPEEQY
ncbi:unnamed protein product [Spirodela intermedia]|uniref:Uncharacterized protein n=1 Tax=Spirodela intermedia TaxID=51605 RepID=A0A7I8ILC6_SPIIN|nr:unnamed protein product [Spirodela intermedia]CAA6658215.1 unnamed protein product [Spirodela intermedia]